MPENRAKEICNKLSGARVFTYNRLAFRLLCVLLLAGLLTGCGTKKRLAKTPLEDRSTGYLLEKLKNSDYEFDYLTAKMSVNADIDGKDNNFTVHLRARKDSVIWMSIRLLSVEVARVLISQDSVKVIDRGRDRYFIGDMEYISRFLGMDMEFEMLQSLLIGNKYWLFRQGRYKSFIDGENYLLSNKSIRMLKKLPIKEEKDRGRLMIHNLWLNPETFKIARVQIVDLKDDINFEASYSNFKGADTLLFPFKANFEVTTDKKMNISVEYNRVNNSREVSFPFSIPEKYEQITIPEERR